MSVAPTQPSAGQLWGRWMAASSPTAFVATPGTQYRVPLVSPSPWSRRRITPRRSPTIRNCRSTSDGWRNRRPRSRRRTRSHATRTTAPDRRGFGRSTNREPTRRRWVATSSRSSVRGPSSMRHVVAVVVDVVSGTEVVVVVVVVVVRSRSSCRGSLGWGLRATTASPTASVLGGGRVGRRGDRDHQPRARP